MTLGPSYRLRDGVTIEDLEELIAKGYKREDQQIARENQDRKRRARDSELERLSQNSRICGYAGQDSAIPEPKWPTREERELQRAEEELLKTGPPELVASIKNSKLLESQLAEKELEIRRLTALVAKLEIEIRDSKKK